MSYSEQTFGSVQINISVKFFLNVLPAFFLNNLACNIHIRGARVVNAIIVHSFSKLLKGILMKSVSGTRTRIAQFPKTAIANSKNTV